MKPTVLHIHFWADIRNMAGSVEKVITAFAAHGARYKHMIACCPGGKALCGPSFLHRGVEVHQFYENQLLNRVMNKTLAPENESARSLLRVWLSNWKNITMSFVSAARRADENFPHFLATI